VKRDPWNGEMPVPVAVAADDTKEGLLGDFRVTDGGPLNLLSSCR
jgi:hypothetical protein